MRLSTLTRCVVVASVFGGFETGAIAHDGFLYVNGTFTTIAVPSAWQTIPTRINNAGQIVGYTSLPCTAASCAGIVGFLYSGGAYSTIEVPGRYYTFLSGINDKGQIVGSTDFGDGFLYSNGTFSPLKIPDAYATIPQGINNAGQIVGTVYTPCTSMSVCPDPNASGFLYSGGTFSIIDATTSRPLEAAPDTRLQTFATDINDAGQIVGDIYGSTTGTHGFLYSGGTFSAIDVPGAQNTSVSDINNAGQIVGTFQDRTGNHGFLYSSGTFSSFDFPCFTDTTVQGMNDAGQITGGNYNTVPAPEPGSLVLFSVGLSLLGLAWCSRRRTVTARIE